MKIDHLRLASALLLISILHAPATVLYVDVSSTNPVPPYTNWTGAAAVIQHAVDAASPGDTILVTNGVYQTGGCVATGTQTNRVAVTKPLTLQSVNGPEVTIIRGYQLPGPTNGNSAIRCVYLTNDAVLSGFTLTKGATRAMTIPVPIDCYGGGALCESMSPVLTNCILVDNMAGFGGGGVNLGTLNRCSISNNWVFANCYGGGAYQSFLRNCLLVSNTADFGGGAASCTLDRCRVIGNTATNLCGQGGGVASCTASHCLIFGNHATTSGGGASSGELNHCVIVGNRAGGVFAGLGSSGGAASGKLTNCIVYFNSALNYPNYNSGTLRYCCTTPLASGEGNFTADPGFVDYPGGDLHLQTNSPCINSGMNSSVTSSTDLDGNPRIVGSAVDVGAYEFQSPQSVLPYQWLQKYGLPVDGSADYADTDGDLMNSWQEFIAGTVPNNALSLLKLWTPTQDTSGITLGWYSVYTKAYFLQRSTNLTAQPPFITIQSNLSTSWDRIIVKDTTATNAGPYFYRVGVQ